MGVENLLHGEIVSANGDTSRVRVGSLELSVPAPDLSGEVLCTIRPEDVVISDAARAGDNVLEARVSEITDGGFAVRMRLSLDGFEVVASVPRANYRGLRCAAGEPIFVDLPLRSLHCFREDQ